MTAAERKNAERAKKRATGLVPMEVWVAPQHAELVRAYIAELMAKDCALAKGKKND